jgi:glycosyltransferase involved in cell wall biosynthesis
MNIGIVYPSLRAVGGAENVIVWLAESLAKRGHTVVVFTTEFSGSAWGTAEHRPYSVHLLNVKKYRSTLKTNRAAGAILREALSAHDIDLINPHNYPASLWVHYARSGAARIPRVMLYLHNLTRNFYGPVIDAHFRRLPGFRNIWNRYRPKRWLRSARQALFGYRKLDQAAVRSCDRVLANSAYTAQLAERIYGIPVAACTLGVSPERYGIRELGAKEGTAERGRVPVVLTVARLEIQKNIDTLLRAVALLRSRSPSLPFQVKIAGSGPQLSYFQRKSVRMGLADTVEFLGFVPGAKIGSLYAGADFLVHIPLDEPFGLVPAEAALFRKPSIVSDHGGPAEIVQNGITGLHVDALVPSRVADKIEELIRQPESVRSMGDAAFSWVMQNMTWDIFADRYDAFLRQTASTRIQQPG